MIFTNDIYRFIGDTLYDEGFRDIRNVPLNVIEEKIREFLRSKLYEKDTTIDTLTLLSRLDSFLSYQHNREQMMANFIFYLLWYFSNIQDYEVVWMAEDVLGPYFKESKFAPGKIEALITGKEIDYINTFSFVLESLKELTNNKEMMR